MGPNNLIVMDLLAQEMKQLKNTTFANPNYTDLFILQKNSPDFRKIGTKIRNLYLLGQYQIPDECHPLKEINELSNSTKNKLYRNDIIFIEQLSLYTKEMIYNFNQIGKVTYNEIICACERYGIELSTYDPIKQIFSLCKIPFQYIENLYCHKITDLAKLEQITSVQLLHIYNDNYTSAAAVYRILVYNHITLSGKKQFIFEYIPVDKALIIWHHLQIETISQLSNYTERQLIESTNINKLCLQKLKSAMQILGISFRKRKVNALSDKL